MLAKYYRFWAVNNTGQTMTFETDGVGNAAQLNLRILPWKYVDGVLTYYDAITDDLGFSSGTLTDGSSTEGDVQDNRTNLYQGAKCFFEAKHDHASASGTVDLYMEESDDNTNWPSDVANFDDEVDGMHAVSLTIGNDENHGANFSI
jgi:hypothetical protein